MKQGSNNTKKNETKPSVTTYCMLKTYHERFFPKCLSRNKQGSHKNYNDISLASNLYFYYELHQ